VSLLPEDETERLGWGPFSLPAGHPFQPAAQMHDRIFESREKGFRTMSRDAADSALLASMLRIAEERKSASLKAQAYVFYGLARMFGGLFW
jgi:hypothetical protein